MTRSVAALAMLAVAGCQGADEPGALDHASQPILGGTVDTANAYPAVVGIEITRPSGSVRFCSGTIIANRTVLTSSGCVVEQYAAGTTDGIVVGVGVDFATATKLGVERVYMNRDDFDPGWGGPPGLYDDGDALLRLDGDPGVAPISIRAFAGTEWGALHGDTLFLVGYGATDPEGPAAQVRHSVAATVSYASKPTLRLGEDGATACAADRGGAVVDPEGRFIAMIGYSADCAGEVYARRAFEFIFDRFIDQFEGPCRVDGTCVAEGCRTPDPDCDPTGCSWNGTCVTDCFSTDEDCPVGNFGGAPCTSGSECELGCVVDPAFPNYPYCHAHWCTAGTTECPPGMGCIPDIDDEGGEGRCRWVVTPCDPTHPEPCLDGACVPSAEYPGLNVCAVGGGCAVAAPAARRPAAPALFGGALAALAVLLLRRPRRSR